MRRSRSRVHDHSILFFAARSRNPIQILTSIRSERAQIVVCIVKHAIRRMIHHFQANHFARPVRTIFIIPILQKTTHPHLLDIGSRLLISAVIRALLGFETLSLWFTFRAGVPPCALLLVRVEWPFLEPSRESLLRVSFYSQDLRRLFSAARCAATAASVSSASSAGSGLNRRHCGWQMFDFTATQLPTRPTITERNVTRVSVTHAHSSLAEEILAKAQLAAPIGEQAVAESVARSARLQLHVENHHQDWTAPFRRPAASKKASDIDIQAEQVAEAANF